MAKNPAVKALKADLRLAEASFEAAKRALDANAARAALDRIQAIKSHIRVLKASASYDLVLDDARKQARRQARKLVKQSRRDEATVYKARALSGDIKRPADPGLEQIKMLRGLVDHQDLEMRRGALEKLRDLLTSDELADVLNHQPEQLVGKRDGADPAQQEEEGRVAQMLKMASDRSLPASERAAAQDWLRARTAGDERASTALAEIIAKSR